MSGILIACGSCGAPPKQIPDGQFFTCEYCRSKNFLPGRQLSGKVTGQCAISQSKVAVLTLAAWDLMLLEAGDCASIVSLVKRVTIHGGNRDHLAEQIVAYGNYKVAPVSTVNQYNASLEELDRCIKELAAKLDVSVEELAKVPDAKLLEDVRQALPCLAVLTRRNYQAGETLKALKELLLGEGG